MACILLVIILLTERTTSAVCLFALELRIDMPVAVLVCAGLLSPYPMEVCPLSKSASLQAVGSVGAARL